MPYDLQIWSLPFDYDANIRFDPANLPAIGISFKLITDVNIPAGARWRMTEMSIDVPVSSTLDISSGSYVGIGQQGTVSFAPHSWWWITSTEPVSNRETTVRLHLRRDWTHVMSHNSFKGNFTAMPTHTNPHLKMNPGTWPVDSQVAGLIPRIEDAKAISGQDVRVFWVQIVTSRSLESGLDTDEDASSLCRYGLFVAQRSTKGVPDTLRVKLKDPVKLNRSLTMKEIVNGLDEFLNKLNESFTASDIVDVHISERCPHPYAYTEADGFSVNGSGPDIIYEDNYGDRYGLWTVEEAGKSFEFSFQLNPPSKVVNTGSIAIIDTTGNVVCDVPAEPRQFRCETFADYTGIFTRMQLMTPYGVSQTDTVYIFAEGHLPFTGDNWITYQAQQRGYDRELMNINRDKALADTANSIGQVGGNAVMGFMMGGPVGALATTAVGVAGTLIGTGINLSAEDRMQQAKEAQQRILSGSAFNAGYGFVYVVSSLKNSAHVRYYFSSIPDAYLEEYVKYHGYPAEGNRIIDGFTKGFWRGAILCMMSAGSPSAPMECNYILKRILNEDLAIGFRFIESKDDI